MNEIKIITELCAEDRARIDKLTAALESLAAGLATAGTPFEGPSIDGEKLAEIVDHGDFVEIVPEPEEAIEPEAPEEPEVANEPEHTQAELQQKVISLVSSGKKDDVKKIIEQYAPRVSAIPAEKINEVWDKLTALEG